MHVTGSSTLSASLSPSTCYAFCYGCRACSGTVAPDIVYICCWLLSNCCLSVSQNKSSQSQEQTCRASHIAAVTGSTVVLCCFTGAQLLCGTDCTTCNSRLTINKALDGGVLGRVTLIEAKSRSILRHVMIACFCSASVVTAAPPQAASICSAAAKATASCLTCDASGAVLDAPYQDTGLEGSAGSFR